MNDELRKMTECTMYELEKRGALPEKSTSAKRRYAADYIVKKSAFAPFFQRLGITRGCQIGRSFDTSRSVYFFSAVVKLYYMAVLMPEELDGRDVISIFKSDDWKREEFWITRMFGHMCRLLYMWMWGNMGEGPEEDSYFAFLQKDIVATANKRYSNPVCLFEFEKYANPVTLAAVASAYEWQKSIITLHHMGKMANRMQTELLRHGTARDVLKRCVGRGVDVYKADPEIIENLTGGKNIHEIDAKAEQYLNWLKAVTDAMEQAQLIPDDCAAPWDIIESRKTEPVVKENETESSREREQEEQKLKESVAHMIDAEGNYTTTGNLAGMELPARISALADALAKKHGTVHITSEASGIHINIPSPELLMTDGIKELESRHLAINAEKYLGVGRYDIDEFPTAENKMLYKKYRREGLEVPSASCMKTGKRYSVAALLSMPPIEKRLNLIGQQVQRHVQVVDTSDQLVYDDKGNLVCRPPGRTEDILQLEPNHPARWYLRERGLSDKRIDLYGLKFCSVAMAEDRAKSIYYSRLPDGCKNSPQNRIIIPIVDDKGVTRAWQARGIEYTTKKNEKWLFCDDGMWRNVWDGENGWHYVSETFPTGFKKYHKYLNAPGMSRNELLFGIPQAIACQKKYPYEQRYAVLVEGPMDVMKGGPPCIAVMGAAISPDQADILKKHFSHFALAMDNDVAGNKLRKNIYLRLNGFPITEITVPGNAKDFGDLTEEEAGRLVLSASPQRRNS